MLAGRSIVARVLVVDDHANIADLIATILSESGLEVDVATSVERGIKLAKANRPDVALVDLMMEGDGMTVCDQLRELYRAQVPIIVVSAGGNSARSMAQNVGARFLPKPFELDELLRQVQAAL